MPSGADRGRTLAAVLVYNGRDCVPRCVESVRRLDKGTSPVDLLVLDDHSPDAGWSEEVRDLCLSLGLPYYRSPRNLGIPRNMNLALLRALSAGYEYVLILNSDTVVPYGLVDGLVAVAEAEENVGSVTAWSNSCSIYSLVNDDPEQFLSGQEDVEWCSEVLAAGGSATIDIPVGVGFCLLLPTAAVRQVGLFDPVFGRGYCEENDWCLRAKAAGLRNLLATNVFVYHAGGGSTRGAGLVAPGETTVQAHERIIDWRYPSYRQDVADFERAGHSARLRRDGISRIILSAAHQWGYDIRLSELPQPADTERKVSFVMRPDGGGRSISGQFRGFRATFELDPLRTVLENLVTLVGKPADRVAIASRGPQADDLGLAAARDSLPVKWSNPYPERI